MAEKTLSVAVIGGGAAGLMAAGYAKELDPNAEVVLFEKNDNVGKKLSITGKGRCNVTNNCEINEFLENVPRNPRFLYSALNLFSPHDTMAFFEGRGIPLKTERGRRVFPLSDKSFDIVNALKGYCSENKVRLIHRKVLSIEQNGVCFSVICHDKSYDFDRVIIATGGASYPTTGSDGDGYKFAKKLGIDVTSLRPSLVPLETEERFVKELMGLSLKNVGIKAVDSIGNICYDDFGEMLFTHFGLSGPTILSMSAHLPEITPGKYKVIIDLKPALDEKTLDKRILSDFEKYKNRNFDNSLSDLLPSKMASMFVKLSGIAPYRKVNTITKEERARLVALFKSFSLTIKRPRPISEAIITSGGINVSEISPKTMESKKIKGLYFAGEVIDVDAYTGGYNLQIAFCTARLAAKSAVT